MLAFSIASRPSNSSDIYDTRRCRLGSATRTSSTRCATPSCRRIGSRVLLAPIDRLSSHLIMTPGGWGQNGAIEPPASTRSVGFGELEVEQAEIRGLGSGTHRAGDPLAGVERK